MASNKEQEKARRERLIFAEFATVANELAETAFDVVSIKSETPPFPDISCKSAKGRHYFELTEITDKDLARRVSASLEDGCSTAGAYSQDDPLLKAFSSKEQAHYVNLDGPLELLAYYDKQSPPPLSLLMDSTRACLYWVTQRMTVSGPWTRLWIYCRWPKSILAVLGNSDADSQVLKQLGFDAVIWQQGDDFGRANTRRLTLRFSDGVVTHCELVANAAQSRYAIDIVPPEWKQHGIEDVWAMIQPPRSTIYFRMQNRNELVKVTKNY